MYFNQNVVDESREKETERKINYCKRKKMKLILFSIE